STMLLSPDEKVLYVALANSDQVSVLSRSSGEVRYISTRLPGQQVGGSYPSGLALSPDAQRLFVANASNNAVGVFDLQQASFGRALGFVPTESYPTALAIVAGDLFIAASKGSGTGPNDAPGEAGTAAARGMQKRTY